MEDLRIEDVREFLKIDKFKLDEACVNQADVFFNVSEKSVLAVAHKDFAKENLAVVDAEVASKVRQEAKDKGEKITEAKIQQLVLTSEEHSEAHSGYIEAIKNAEMWKAMKDAFLQKSSMIKELCSLFIQNYYSDITIKSAEVSSDNAVYANHRQKIKDRKNKNI